MIMNQQENKDLDILIAFLKKAEIDREKLNNFDWLELTLKNCTTFKLIKNLFEYVATIWWKQTMAYLFDFPLNVV